MSTSASTQFSRGWCRLATLLWENLLLELGQICWEWKVLRLLVSIIHWLMKILWKFCTGSIFKASRLWQLPAWTCGVFTTYHILHCGEQEEQKGVCLDSWWCRIHAKDVVWTCWCYCYEQPDFSSTPNARYQNTMSWRGLFITTLKFVSRILEMSSMLSLLKH